MGTATAKLYNTGHSVITYVAMGVLDLGSIVTMCLGIYFWAVAKKQKNEEKKKSYLDLGPILTFSGLGGIVLSVIVIVITSYYTKAVNSNSTTAKLSAAMYGVGDIMNLTSD